jgi:hypothetical protein
VKQLKFIGAPLGVHRVMGSSALHTSARKSGPCALERHPYEPQSTAILMPGPVIGMHRKCRTATALAGRRDVLTLVAWSSMVGLVMFSLVSPGPLSDVVAAAAALIAMLLAAKHARRNST